MKKVLIVLAHPYAKSFNHELAQNAVQALTKKNYKVEVLDLFKDRSIATFDIEKNFKKNREVEILNYKNLQKDAFENANFEKMVEQDQQALIESDIVIFQFPLWWFSMPSIMRNWIEKTYTYGFAYNGREGKWFQNGVFKNKKAMLSITTSGPKSSYKKSGINGDIDTILWPIQNGILNFLGYDVLEPNICWGTDTESYQYREDYIKEYVNIIENIESREAIILPTI